MKRHYVFAITAPVFWSLAGVVVKSLEQATEWQINFYRCLSLTLFVAAVTLIRYRRSTLAVLRMGGLKTIISGALLSGAMLCNVVALKYTTVAVAVFVMAAAPILAALLGRLFLGEEVRARVWVSIVLAILGIGIMVGGRLQIGDTLGVAVAILGIVFFGIYAVSLRVGKNVDMTPAVSRSVSGRVSVSLSHGSRRCGVRCSALFNLDWVACCSRWLHKECPPFS